MKKLKLSRSKPSDVKQQKISNFFPTKPPNSFTAKSPVHEEIKNLEQKVQEDKTVPNRQSSKELTIQSNTKIKSVKELDLENSSKLTSKPVQKLCSTCLQASPTSEIQFCNHCNKSPLTPKISTESSLKEIKSSELGEYDSKPSKLSLMAKKSCDSPDLIPPTPPFCKKNCKQQSKSIKRKFDFTEVGTGNASKKLTSQEQTGLVENESEDKTLKASPLNTDAKLTSNKREGKENDLKLFKRNSLSKSLSKTSIVTKRHSSESAESQSKLISSIAYASTVQNSFMEIKNIDSENENKDVSLNYSNDKKKAKNTKTLKINNENCVDDETNKMKNKFESITEKPNDGIIDFGVSSTSDQVFESKKENHASLPGVVFKLKEQDVAENISSQCIDLNDSFLDDLNFLESSQNEGLQLSDGLRCTVVSVERLSYCQETILTLKKHGSLADSQTAICILRGTWTNTDVSVGDTVSVSAVTMTDQEGCWVVDNDRGRLVMEPDMLVSGTTIVGSLFCQRRSVLSDMYRGLDSDSSIMLIGCFLHELLQEVLKKKVSTLEEIKQILKYFISSPKFIFSLFSSSMDLKKTVETLEEFVPKIHGFVQKYIKSPSSLKEECSAWNSSDSWRGVVTDVADIEENIWSPRLGIKGKVDVTVNTMVRNKHRVMPLELKTGRASFSAEHRGQVILYTMMMSELGQPVDSGLLLYLREGVMKEVEVGSVERRDLMMLRNQLVTRLRASQSVVMTDAQIAPPTLPPPINHHSACSKCPYLTLCSAALRVSGLEGVSESNPLQGLSVVSTEHLEMEHILYVFHWTGLLRLEHTDTHRNSPALHDIWTLPPSTRKKRGTCVPNMRLAGEVTEVAPSCYQHVFETAVDSETDELSALREGDYVIVSCDKRPAVAAGPVRHMEHNQITLHLERDLSVSKRGKIVWHLDKYESQSGLVFNMTNLGCLLDNTQQAERLRKSVVSLELPKFQPKLSSRVMKLSVDLVSHLNPQQTRAIYTALAAEHFVLIKGMPGTGKTATLVALIELAVRLGLSVLITSHTHSAVDNVLLRLRDRVDFLRLGATHKLHPHLVKYGEKLDTCKTPQDLQTYYNSKNVVAVTCQGSSHPLLTRRQFDLCLVDEASQVLQPTVLRPLFSARKFVLIGDPDQLPPLVRSTKAKELGLGQSLFVRLDRPAVTVELSLQYRMNQTITDLANSLTYQGKLKCANEQVTNTTLTLDHTQVLVDQPDWLVKALSQKLCDSVIVLDTGEVKAVNQTNHREADLVCQITSALKQCGLSDEQVGVIAPYRAQVELLQRKLQPVEVNTVDQYQGRDKDAIIYSCTRSIIPTGSDILGDRHRMTVAITRARHKLIIIGNVSLLRSYELFNSLFQSLHDGCIVPVT